MDNGELVNINATTELLQPEFKRNQNEGKNVFVIDGFPRSIEILDHWNKVHIFLFRVCLFFCFCLFVSIYVDILETPYKQ